MSTVTAILLLCTANACRSVMAQAMLTARLPDHGTAARVDSAATHGGGYAPPAEVIEIMAARGLDVSRHRGRRVTTADLAAADLVLGMAREHVRQAAVLLPAVWPRAFTLPEIVRRGHQAGPRLAGEPVGDWLTRVGHGRTRAELLGVGPADDIADPAGGPPDGYRATAALLDDLTSEFVSICWPG